MICKGVNSVILSLIIVRPVVDFIVCVVDSLNIAFVSVTCDLVLLVCIVSLFEVDAIVTGGLVLLVCIVSLFEADPVVTEWNFDLFGIIMSVSVVCFVLYCSVTSVFCVTVYVNLWYVENRKAKKKNLKF